MKKAHIDWKRNIRKVPDWILAKIRGFKKKDVIVACVVKIPASSIFSGKYAHLSLKIEDGKPVFPSSIVPDESIGKHSGINVNGYELIRRDLPKISKTYSWDAPDYGDWSIGSHEVSIDRKVYRRDFIPPRLTDLRIELLGQEMKDETHFVFKFIVNEVLDSSARRFKVELLHDLNLLQENVGNLDVFPSDATMADFLKTIYVHWEILPPGDRDDTINRIFVGFETTSDEVKQKLIARYDFLSKLKPLAYIRGTSGFRRYFGAKFTDDLVVFENLEYGNAVYVMFDEWEKLSRLNRIELLSGSRKGFVRVVHRTGWQSVLTKVIKEER